MKFCLMLAALIALCSVGQCQAVERPALSLTTFRGYVYSSGRWQPHICRTLSSARTQQVVQSSPTGAPRQLGHTVRCHHGVMFVPGDPNRGVMTAPNRSSRFVPRAAHRTLVITVEIHTDRYELPNVILPRPPYAGGPQSPVIVEPPAHEPDQEIILVLIEENRVLRSAPYRLPPPPLFPRLPQ